ncbi:hypothetical protein [Luteimonas salinilitoris]|uniref:Uncharacterized protein n=1 Tax=Luteimonas salinilitoris TaxID=3237697 RepID=A0ABV4HUM5_9GAMM
MPTSSRVLLLVLAIACFAPHDTLAQAPAMSPEKYAQAAQMRDFVASFMHGQVVATCAQQGYGRSEQLTASYAAWQEPVADSIAEGETVMLETYPEDFDGSKEKLREEMLKRYRKDTEPVVVSRVGEVCDARLMLLETGLPIPSSGTTATAPTLRADIFSQGMMATTCWAIESIEMSVVKADPAATSEEQWIFSGCGKPVATTVTYSANPTGGTNFVVGMKSDALTPAERRQRLEAAKRQLEEAKKAQATGNAANQP